MTDKPKRKNNRLKGFDYSVTGVYFLTVCTKNRRCVLSRIEGTSDTLTPVGTERVNDGSLTGVSPVDTLTPVGTERVNDGSLTGVSPVDTLTPVGTGVLDGPHVVLTKYGRIAEKYIKQISDFYDDISVLHYVIMPNHIHILLQIWDMRTVGDAGPYKADMRTVGDAGPYDGKAKTGRFLQIAKEGVSSQNSTVSRFVSIFKRFCNKEYGENVWQMRSHDHIIRDQNDYGLKVEYILKNPTNWYYDELYSDE